ncbi:uncharacterized protein DUF2637 [Streptomyces sp. Ag82_O1-15]|uniref:DUF2637 domain-containing protein n=1 Tax=Streptomyces sp. Ag82_O1-15 TaxID=1938855 RepID=UPI000BB0F020|nr:DUF2637 domain-containing protein [Streptomyces sp. Ag82_O1-15]PBC96175.1 uncharacterized protein DUF2637 [Streptomyces sp. Ag82_O1-15]PBC96198.1 uncharacterized protein DUF2637 [Streptomyces sp. Ag82_O1-15]
MTTMTQTTERPTVPPLTTPELWLLGAVAVLAAGVGGLGLASSFEAVSAAGARWGFASPWMLPVGIDTAIPVFTAAFLLLIRTDMPLGWVRFVPWALTGVTCWLNIAAGHSLSAKLAHGTMPLLWVVLSEVAAHVYASRIGAVTGRRMEKIRRSRWVLAPLSTFALWRRMTLWEVTSYSDALGRERERQLARAQLRQQHGRRWRSKTPRPERVLLKLGELAPAGEDLPSVPPQNPKPPKQDAPKPPRKRTAKAKPTKAARTPAELLAEARTATAEWTDDAVNAEAIRTTLHCSAANSRVLRDLLLSERADGRRLHPITDTDDGEHGEGAAA